MNKTLKFYKERLKWKAKKLNHVFSLQEDLMAMVGNKKQVVIADLGSGPFTIVGAALGGVYIQVVASDILADEYKEMLYTMKIFPIVPVEKQDMEDLTYDDESFDIVHCANALDHTRNPKRALMEMYRVCKIGGWIYLCHFPNVGERRRYRDHHRWNISSTGRIWNEGDEFLLSELLPNFTTRAENHMNVSELRK